MEYIYAALLLHKLGHKVTEENLKRVLDSAGAKVDLAKVKSLVAALDSIDIETAIKEAAMAPVASSTVKEEKKEEKKKEEKVDETVSAAGLGALFG